MAAVVILLLIVGAYLAFFGFAKRASAATNGTKGGLLTTTESRTPDLRPSVVAPAPAKVTMPVLEPAPTLSQTATPTDAQLARLARDPSIEFFTFAGKTVGGIRLRSTNPDGTWKFATQIVPVGG